AGCEAGHQQSAGCVLGSLIFSATGCGPTAGDAKRQLFACAEHDSETVALSLQEASQLERSRSTRLRVRSASEFSGRGSASGIRPGGSEHGATTASGSGKGYR